MFDTSNAVMNIRGGSDNIAVLEWVSKFTSRDETAGVSDISHQKGVMLISNGAKGGIVPVTGVRRGTADDQAGLEDLGLRLEAVVVDELGGGVEAVGEGLEVDRRRGHLLFGGL